MELIRNGIIILAIFLIMILSLKIYFYFFSKIKNKLYMIDIRETKDNLTVLFITLIGIFITCALVSFALLDEQYWTTSTIDLYDLLIELNLDVNLIIAFVEWYAMFILFTISFSVSIFMLKDGLVNTAYYILRKINILSYLSDDEDLKVFINRVEYRGIKIPLKNIDDIYNYTILNDTDFNVSSLVSLVESGFKHDYNTKTLTFADYNADFTLIYTMDYNNGEEDIVYLKTVLMKNNNNIETTKVTCEEFCKDMLLINPKFTYKQVQF